jgi:hypothetical protein
MFWAAATAWVAETATAAETTPPMMEMVSGSRRLLSEFSLEVLLRT